MKRIDLIENRVIIENNDTMFNYFAWPTVARLKNGMLAAVASGYRLDHICPFGKGVMALSADEGKTWSKPRIIFDTPLDDRDCGILPCGESNVIVTSFNNSVAFQREKNKKRESYNFEMYSIIEEHLNTIDAEKEEEKWLGNTYRISNDNGATFGEIKRSGVSCPHGPIEMPGGEILYIGCAGERLECHRLNENNDFEFLSCIENIGDAFGDLCSCEPHSIVLPDGKIIVHIRVQREKSQGASVFTVYQCESRDFGKSFTKPHRLLENMGGSPPHIIRHSSGTLVSVYGYRCEPCGVRAMFSRDGGETWDTDYILVDDGPNKDLGYPASVELKNGDILTVYYMHNKPNTPAVIKQCIWRLP